MNTTEDRLDVIEICNRFGWHADQRQWDESRSLLADRRQTAPRKL